MGDFVYVVIDESTPVFTSTDISKVKTFLSTYRYANVTTVYALCPINGSVRFEIIGRKLLAGG